MAAQPICQQHQCMELKQTTNVNVMIRLVLALVLNQLIYVWVGIFSLSDFKSLMLN